MQLRVHASKCETVAKKMIFFGTHCKREKVLRGKYGEQSLIDPSHSKRERETLRAALCSYELSQEYVL